MCADEILDIALDFMCQWLGFYVPGGGLVILLASPGEIS